MGNVVWWKSSFSNDVAECLEVALVHDGILLRESDDPAVVISTTRERLEGLLRAIKSGALDRLV